jgi:hypothetical protein
MTRIGRLPLPQGRAIRNDCYQRDLCSVQYDNGGAIPSPVAGTLRCRTDGRGDLGYALESGRIVLHLEAGGGHDFESRECDVREVAAGEPLPRAEYLGIEAYGTDGSPLSLVVTRDGEMYVGDVKLEIGCPCEPRS